jgi:amino acid adenylation domain-containing protein
MSLETTFAQTSFAQQRLWFFDQLQPGTPLYNIQATTRLSGRLQLDVLQQALNEIIIRHQALRTVFRSQEGQPIQVILSSVTVPIPEVDLSQLTNELRNAEVSRIARSQFGLRFDLEQGPLLRVILLKLGADDQLIVLTVHHLVFDGWSVGIFFNELAIFYDAFRSGRRSPLPELPLQYSEFAARQRALLQDGVLDAQLAYWREQLRGAPGSVDIPTDRPRPPIQTFSGAIRPLAIAPTVVASLREVSQAAGLTLYMTLLAALAVLLHRYSGQEDLVIGTPIANRGRPELEPLIGFLVNTLVLRVDISGDPSFLELAQRVREVALGAYAHQDVPFEKIVAELCPGRDPSRSPLFQIMFVFQNAMGGSPTEAVDKNPLREELGHVQVVAARFDLTLTVTDLPRRVHGTLEYNTDLFDASTIDRMAGHLEVLLAGIASTPRLRVSELPLLTTAERQQLLVEWNDSKQSLTDCNSVLQLFQRQAAERPDAIALTWHGRHVTYEELNIRATTIARALRVSTASSGMRVGICADRSADLVAALVGAMKAGAAAVPLDPAYPEERLAFMMADAELHVVLTQTWLRNRVLHTGAHVICLDEPFQAPFLDDGPSAHAPENIAYVIYTSGSTGMPKGVLIEHGSLSNVIAAQVRAWDVQTDSRVLQFASLSFDAAMSEIFMALTAGACLCLASREELLPGPPLARTLQTQRITIVTLPPSTLAALPLKPLPDLRTLVLAGEACDAALAGRWAAGRKVFNAYGPTEATICATFGEYDHANSRFPIGRPIDNAQIYLLDPFGNPVPIGVKGEIHIGGIGVARGYLHQASLTEQLFYRNHFVDDPDARLYRTGDFARYTLSGNLEYLGRIDQQVKVRGFRIEIGEVENALRQHARVKDAAVIARDVPPSDRMLAAYVVDDDKRVSVPELRSFLRRRLPDYMIPAAITVLAELPRTPNGKVDRQALPDSGNLREGGSLSYVAPHSEVERSIAALWQELLGLERVGLNDNFFDLGGHSLLLVKLHDRLQHLLKIELPLVDLFRYPTINSLAESLGHVEKSTTLLDRVEERIAKQTEARIRRSRNRRAEPSE